MTIDWWAVAMIAVGLILIFLAAIMLVLKMMRELT